MRRTGMQIRSVCERRLRGLETRGDLSGRSGLTNGGEDTKRKSMPFNDWYPMKSILYKMTVATNVGFRFTQFGCSTAQLALTCIKRESCLRLKRALDDTNASL
jgi:hypothetical protein